MPHSVWKCLFPFKNTRDVCITLLAPFAATDVAGTSVTFLCVTELEHACKQLSVSLTLSRGVFCKATNENFNLQAHFWFSFETLTCCIATRCVVLDPIEKRTTQNKRVSSQTKRRTSCERPKEVHTITAVITAVSIGKDGASEQTVFCSIWLLRLSSPDMK